jgi:flagellar biosynthesis/type III secretory pathway protein FliH
MKRHEVEAARLLAEIKTLKAGWTVSEQADFDALVAAGLGLETEGSYDQGREDGYDDGYDEGYSAGYDEGYANGKDENDA